MKITKQHIGIIIAFVITGLLVGSGMISSAKKHHAFDARNLEIKGYSATTLSRLVNSMFTLDGDILVGFKGTTTQGYKLKDGRSGTLSMDTSIMRTKFVPGIFGKREGHLDIILPMKTTVDKAGSSTFIVLYKDRGDALIEQSFARLSDNTAVVQKIQMLDGVVDAQEYIADITYTIRLENPQTKKVETVDKQVRIPVIDGHFDPEGTVTVK